MTNPKKQKKGTRERIASLAYRLVHGLPLRESGPSASLKDSTPSQRSPQPEHSEQSGKSDAEKSSVTVLHEELQDTQYYRKITELIPNLASYKVQTIEHLRERAAALDIHTLKEYYTFLLENEKERTWLQTNLTLKGTHFFRGEGWEYLNTNCLSTFAGRKNLRIWCSACSSGEEAYSVLMSVLDYAAIEDIYLLASDYNEELLEKCRAGQYYNMHLDEIPENYRKYVERGKSRYTILPELRNVVHTQCINLLTDPFPAPFDVILCRNVLKFFDRNVIPEIHQKLCASLNPGGFLFLATENDGNNSIELLRDPAALGMEQLDGSSIYRKIGT